MAGRGTHCARWQMHPRARRWVVAWRDLKRGKNRMIPPKKQRPSPSPSQATPSSAAPHVTPCLTNYRIIPWPPINTPTADLGKQTLFVTNNSSMHSDDYKDRFQRCVSPLGCFILFLFFTARFKVQPPWHSSLTLLSLRFDIPYQRENVITAARASALYLQQLQLRMTNQHFHKRVRCGWQAFPMHVPCPQHCSHIFAFTFLTSGVCHWRRRA